LYHIDIKIRREWKYIPFLVINNIKCIKYYITSGFPRLGYVMKQQGV